MAKKLQKMQIDSPHPSQKSLMVEEILCEARRQIRSIVGLCEEFGVRRYRAKFTHQNDFFNKKNALRVIVAHSILDCLS